MKKWEMRQEAFSALSDFSQENFSGIAVVKAFVKEACLLRNYKRMSKFMAVLSFILVLPWVCALLWVLAAYYCCLAMYKLAEAPVAQIKGCMEESGEKVKHATQFFIGLHIH